MNTINYQSPSIILFQHHQIPIVEGNSIIDNWLKQHPQESRATLSKLLESKQVLIKDRKLIDLPQLSLAQANQLVQEIQQSGKLEIKERQYQLKYYRSCFIGSELVDYLVDHKDCLIEEAVALGQSLLKYDLIQHVLNEHEFENEFLFYFFKKKYSKMSANDAKTLLNEIQQNNALEIKDRWYKLKCYKQCFLGTELVDYLTNSKNISVVEAVNLGQGLIEHNMIQHVLEKHDFKNEALFYIFKKSEIISK